MRNRHFLILDILLLAALPALATALRFETFAFLPDIVRALIWYSLLILPARIAIAYTFGLYRSLWRHAGLSEVQRIFFAGIASAVASVFLGTIGITATGVAPIRLPYIALALDAILTLAVFASTYWSDLPAAAPLGERPPRARGRCRRRGAADPARNTGQWPSTTCTS